MNKIKNMGFLELLGILTGNYGIFGFFGFFGISNIKNDEMLKKNIERAGLDGFFISMLGLAILIVLSSIHVSKEILIISIASIYALQIIVFTFSFNLRESMWFKKVEKK